MGGALLAVGLREAALWYAVTNTGQPAAEYAALFATTHAVVANLLFVIALDVLYATQRRFDVLTDAGRLTEELLREENRDLEAKIATSASALEIERAEAEVAVKKASALYADQRTQLELAAKLQTATMTMCEDTPPWSFASWFEPANQISGDMLRTELTEDGAARVFVGDAMGHSVSSAMLTMLVSAALEQIELDVSPAQALERMNAAMNSHNTGMYVTGQLLLMHPDGRVLLSNAGHPPAILLRADGTVEMLGEEGGFALGMFGVQLSSYSEAEVQLRAGDLLLLSTDGISELQLADGSRLGDAGLAAMLAPVAGAGNGPGVLIGLLREQLEARWRESADKDDIAALAVGWKVAEGVA